MFLAVLACLSQPLTHRITSCLSHAEGKQNANLLIRQNLETMQPGPSACQPQMVMLPTEITALGLYPQL